MKFKAKKLKIVAVKFTTIFGTENSGSTVKLGEEERFDKEPNGVKEPFPVTDLQFTS